jgi:hypothetical protein
MQLKKDLEDLVRTGWDVIENDFDDKAVAEWREKAARCVAALTISEPGLVESCREKDPHGP